MFSRFFTTKFQIPLLLCLIDFAYKKAMSSHIPPIFIFAFQCPQFKVSNKKHECEQKKQKTKTNNIPQSNLLPHWTVKSTCYLAPLGPDNLKLGSVGGRPYMTQRHVPKG